MVRKEFIYEYKKDDLKDFKIIEKEAFRKANELNDKILDAKILLDEISDDWEEYIQFLEDKKISKYCEFKCETCIDFDDELLNAIVNTLKKSITDTNKSINYNSKKIKINRAING